MLNYSTSAVGSLQVDLKGPDSKPFAGYSLEECPPIYGDRIDAAVGWMANSDLSDLAGRAIRLRIVVRDADVFAFRFSA